MICPDCGGSPAVRDDIPCTHPCHQAAADVVDYFVNRWQEDPTQSDGSAVLRALLATLEEAQAGETKTGDQRRQAPSQPVASPAPSPRDVEEAVEAAERVRVSMLGWSGVPVLSQPEFTPVLAQALAAHARAATDRERERWAPALKALTRIAACDPDDSDPDDWPCRSAWHCQQHLEDGPDGGEPRCPECCSRWWNVDVSPGAGHPPDYWQDAWAAAAIRALPGEGECAKCAKCGLSGHTLTDCTAPVDLRGNGRSA